MSSTTFLELIIRSQESWVIHFAEPLATAITSAWRECIAIYEYRMFSLYHFIRFQTESSSVIFGIVTLSKGFSSIASFIASIAPGFLAQARLATPLFTSQCSIDSIFLADSCVPSINIPKPPLITSPHPTPPPLCRLIQVAPLNESPTKFCTAISAVNIDPSLIFAVSL